MLAAPSISACPWYFCACWPDFKLPASAFHCLRAPSGCRTPLCPPIQQARGARELRSPLEWPSATNWRELMDKDPAREASWLHCPLEELSSSWPHGNLLDNALFFDFHPFPASLPHSADNISWDQLSSKLVVLEFLSQGLILVKLKPTHKECHFLLLCLSKYISPWKSIYIFISFSLN